MFDRFKNPTPPQERSPGEVLHLPDPSFETNTSIEQVVRQPRSIRDYRDAPLILKELSQLLCGMRSGSLRRRITAPRPPKALYPRWRYM